MMVIMTTWEYGELFMSSNHLWTFNSRRPSELEAGRDRIVAMDTLGLAGWEAYAAIPSVTPGMEQDQVRIYMKRAKAESANGR
jgi:hypothetical protein